MMFVHNMYTQFSVSCIHLCRTPVRTRGVKSRMCPPHPQRAVKCDLYGRCVGITVKKGWSRVGAWTGTLKNPMKCLWRWEPDCRSNYFFFRTPAHPCAVTCMTEILLNVTLTNQFTSSSMQNTQILMNIFLVFI